jgi:GNAT superfamily N-acetyltransferase
MITYRTLEPHEEEAVLTLWAQVMEDPYEVRKQVFYDFANDPQRFNRTHIALVPDGAICAAVSYWVREVRDGRGEPCRVGLLWGAATLPAFRRQGVATHLIERLILAMKQEGCRWSILFARDEARPLYERMGWSGFPTLYRGGLVATDKLSKETVDYTVQVYDPQQALQGWQPLARIYEEYNRMRPLSLVRSSEYWHGYVAWVASNWIANQRATYLVATPNGDSTDICGYVLVHYYDQAYAAQHFGSPPWFHVSEIGARTGDALAALLSGIATQAYERDIAYSHFSLPEDKDIDKALEQLFVQPMNRESITGAIMARPVADDFDCAQLEALFTAPGALFWEIDRF